MSDFKESWILRCKECGIRYNSDDGKLCECDENKQEPENGRTNDDLKALGWINPEVRYWP